MSKRYKIGDQVPLWMHEKPDTRMKMEWENASARWIIENHLSARSAKNVNIPPGRLLMHLR